MYNRMIHLPELLEKRSFFLVGPRAAGKTTLIDQTLPAAKIYDLLDPEVFQRLLRAPKIISEETTREQIVVIDEIQKYPTLLDEVHRLIVKRDQRFLLTGSSVRKLKRGGANLLAGRAFQAELFPLIYKEIPNFDLLSYLNTTGLPEFYGKELAAEFLNAYVGTYLKEEIHAEALVRNLPGFTRFLEVIALNNGEELNFAQFSSDTGVPVRTLQGYLSVLDDTLVGFFVPAFQATKKRKAITRAKYYLFDVGVVNNLTRRGRIESRSELFGRAFEHFIALELRAYLSYCRRNKKILQYWRSTSQYEVDFILEEEVAIEVKATDLVTDKHLRGLRALKEEGLLRSYCVVSLDPVERNTEDGIAILPWKSFLEMLWANAFIKA